MNVPALAFSTGFWNGEQLANNPIKVQSLPLDRFHTEFMGHNIGVPGDLLYYKLRDYESSMALAILHDVPVRCEKESDFDTIAAIYRIRETFRCDEATFHGYWESDAPVHVTGDHCHASYWRHPTNGILLAVSNLAEQPRTPRLTLVWEQLGLGPAVNATDVRSGSSIPIDADTIDVSLQGQSWTLIRIAPVNH